MEERGCVCIPGGLHAAIAVAHARFRFALSHALPSARAHAGAAQTWHWNNRRKIEEYYAANKK